MKIVRLTRSPLAAKKFRVLFENGTHIDFGAKGYSDYTMHKDPDRKKRYIIRHQKKEMWGAQGMHTAGFWSRWLLWEKPSLESAKNYIRKRFNISVR